MLKVHPAQLSESKQTELDSMRASIKFNMSAKSFGCALGGGSDFMQQRHAYKNSTELSQIKMRIAIAEHATNLHRGIYQVKTGCSQYAEVGEAPSRI